MCFLTLNLFVGIWSFRIWNERRAKYCLGSVPHSHCFYPISFNEESLDKMLIEVESAYEYARLLFFFVFVLINYLMNYYCFSVILPFVVLSNVLRSTSFVQKH